jgi:hypothetical protein
MIYQEWLELQYNKVINGDVVRDHYAQPIIRDRDVVKQMVQHNKTALENAVMCCLDKSKTATYSRNLVRQLYKEAFFQLAAMHESELRRVYERFIQIKPRG